MNNPEEKKADVQRECSASAENYEAAKETAEIPETTEENVEAKRELPQPDVTEETVEGKRELPRLGVLEQALAREKKKNRILRAVRNLVIVLVVVAALSVLLTTLWMPFLRIYGSSMNPGLHQGDIVTAVKTQDFQRGDLIAFYYNEKVLVKRVIGLPGDVVDIAKNGTVTVNGEELEEPYVQSLSREECGISLPCEVSEGRYFVLGDNRPVSVDSRSREIGCVAQDQIIGKVRFRLWPFGNIGAVS